MALFYLLFSIFLFNLSVSVYFAALIFPYDYAKQRNVLINQGEQYAFGGNLTLSGDEIVANECLMYFKRKEADEAYKDPSKFLPSHNFLKVRHQIEESPVYKIIQMIPKGGILHTHNTAITSASYIVKNLTYVSNLYICLDSEPMRFHFFKTSPNKDCNWKLLSEVRINDSSIDSKIEQALVLSVTSQNQHENEVWNSLANASSIVESLISFRPVFEKYLIRAMDECYADNVMFIEIRFILFDLYDLEGIHYDQVEVGKLCEKISNEYKKTHPNFLGLKMIYSVPRIINDELLQQKIQEYKRMKAALPDFVIGFDIIGREDGLATLENRIDQLKVLSEEGTSFFFHAGQTNWYGHNSDQNLYDAVILNTKRIGHGFALPKHPKLMEIIKLRKIAIEVNPISNQILHLVGDMRNHPASIFFAENMPVIVSNDDPSLWGAKGLSYDFYEAFVGIMSRDADLRALKQLALNSIEYSALNKSEIDNARKIFEMQWTAFTRDLVNSELCVNKMS